MRVECGDCGRHLAELETLSKRPLPRPETVRCECPYCGGLSHPVEMCVRYHLGAAVAFIPDMPDEYRELTAVASVRYDGDVATYRILEAPWQDS